MQTRITARHYTLPDGFREMVEERVESLTKFFDHIIDAHVILSQEKHTCVAEITLKVYGTHLSGKAEADDMRVALEQAVDKMERQLTKYKTKLRQKDPEKINKTKSYDAGSTSAEESL